MTWHQVASRYGVRGVVIANGCFDVLHVGHIRLLQHATKFQLPVIVALNDDASIRRIKGEARPVNRIEARAEMLLELRTVVGVVGFTEDTPDWCLAYIRPYALVKGEDYAGREVAGARHCKRVVFAPLAAGYSTTGILEGRGAEDRL